MTASDDQNTDPAGPRFVIENASDGELPEELLMLFSAMNEYTTRAIPDPGSDATVDEVESTRASREAQEAISDLMADLGDVTITVNRLSPLR